MKFSQQMVKRFYEILNMSSKTDFSHHLTEENDDIRISVHITTSPSKLNAMIIISAATSFWLPFHSQNLFNFFRDPIRRAKVHKLNMIFYFIRISLISLLVKYILHWRIIHSYVLFYFIFCSGMLCVMKVLFTRLDVSLPELILTTIYQLFRYLVTIFFEI